MYSSHKKEMKVKIMTQDYVQNLINPLHSLEIRPQRAKIVLKQPELALDFIKNVFSSAYYSFFIRLYTKTLIVLFFIFQDLRDLPFDCSSSCSLLLYYFAYIANNLGFSSILIFWGWVNSVLPNLSVNI